MHELKSYSAVSGLCFISNLTSNRPIINIYNLTWSLLIKMGSLQIFDHRVSNISAGQAMNSSQKAANRNQQGGYSNRQVYRTSQPHFIDPQFVGYEFCIYIRRISFCNPSFGIWHLTDYIYQHLR